MSLWASFVIDAPIGKIYVVADSGYGAGRLFRRARERHGPFKLAILPIGAYEPRWFMRDQHMNPAEAVQAYGDCGAELALAHHYGTFQLTDEAIDAPVARACRGLEGCRHSGRALPRLAARRGRATLIVNWRYLSKTNTSTVSFLPSAVTGSVSYCSMNRSLASSRFSSR